jgi:hypothetical protein
MESDGKRPKYIENLVLECSDERFFGMNVLDIQHVENLEEDRDVEAVGEVDASVVVVEVVSLFHPTRHHNTV